MNLLPQCLHHPRPFAISQDVCRPGLCMRFLSLHPNRTPTSGSHKLCSPNINGKYFGKLNHYKVRDTGWTIGESESSCHCVCGDVLFHTDSVIHPATQRPIPSGKAVRSCSCLLIYPYLAEVYERLVLYMFCHLKSTAYRGLWWWSPLVMGVQLICSLFNDTASDSGFMAFQLFVITNNDVAGMCKRFAVT